MRRTANISWKVAITRPVPSRSMKPGSAVRAARLCWLSSTAVWQVRRHSTNSGGTGGLQVDISRKSPFPQTSGDWVSAGDCCPNWNGLPERRAIPSSTATRQQRPTLLSHGTYGKVGRKYLSAPSPALPTTVSCSAKDWTGRKNHPGLGGIPRIVCSVTVSGVKTALFAPLAVWHTA